MHLRKPLIITLGLLFSAGCLSAAELQEDGKFLLLTKEEAAALQQKLSSVEGKEREALRQAEYQRLKHKAEQAGYEVPPLAAADTAGQTAKSAQQPAPAPEKPAAAAPVATAGSAPTPAPETAASEASPAPAAAVAVTQTPETPVAETTPPADEASVQTPAPAAPPAPAAEPASPFVQDYQTIRQSHDELVKSMESRRDALRAQMEKRREEMARQRDAIIKRHMSPDESRLLQEQEGRTREHEAEMAARQKKHEEEMAAREKQLEEERLAHIQEMEARRKAMEARINSGINAIGRPVARPYYPRAGWAPRPGYTYPYGPYAYPWR
ncbi:hypothetical protein [Thiolapillus sp.]